MKGEKGTTFLYGHAIEKFKNTLENISEAEIKQEQYYCQNILHAFRCHPNISDDSHG